MIENNVSTDPQNVQTELDLLRWQEAQHRELESKIYCALAFLGDTVGLAEDAAADDLKLSDDARRGLSFICASMRSMIGHACWNGNKPQFYNSLGYFRDSPDSKPQ